MQQTRPSTPREPVQIHIIDIDRLFRFNRFRGVLMFLRFFGVLLIAVVVGAAVIMPLEDRIKAPFADLHSDIGDGVVGILLIAFMVGSALILGGIGRNRRRSLASARSRRPVPGTGMRYNEIRQKVWQRFGPVTDPEPLRAAAAKRHRKRARWFRLVPLAATLPAVASMLTATYTPALQPYLDRYGVAAVSAFAVIAMPVFLWANRAATAAGRAARGLEQELAEERLNRDQRTPVVYLRAFADDAHEITTYRRFDLAMTDQLDGTGFEEALARPFARIGPVLAVGQPGEEVPSIGAAKLYFPQESWQREVRRLMDEAALIVIGLGVSEGVRWEIQASVQPDFRDRALFILPPPTTPWYRWHKRRADRSAMQAARAAPLIQALYNEPVATALKQLDWRDIILLKFRRNGSVVAFKSRARALPELEAALTLAIYDHYFTAPHGKAAPAPP